MTLTVEDLKHAIDRLDLNTSTGVRDWVMLLGFADAFRRLELVTLNIKELEFTEAALIVHLAESQTNQHGEQEDKTVFYTPDAKYCPVRSLRAWAALR